MSSEHIPHESNQPQELHPDVAALMLDLDGQLSEVLDHRSEEHQEFLEGLQTATDDEIREETGSSRDEFCTFVYNLEPGDLEFLLIRGDEIATEEYDVAKKQAADVATARALFNEVFNQDGPDYFDDLTLPVEERAEVHIINREPFVRAEIAVDEMIEYMNQQAGSARSSDENMPPKEERPDTPDDGKPKGPEESQ